LFSLPNKNNNAGVLTAQGRGTSNDHGNHFKGHGLANSIIGEEQNGGKYRYPCSERAHIPPVVKGKSSTQK